MTWRSALNRIRKVRNNNKWGDQREHENDFASLIDVPDDLCQLRSTPNICDDHSLRLVALPPSPSNPKVFGAPKFSTDPPPPRGVGTVLLVLVIVVVTDAIVSLRLQRFHA